MGLQPANNSPGLDLNKIAEMIELTEEVRLTVVVEKRPCTCYACRQKGYIRRMCPQHQQDNADVNHKEPENDAETVTQEIERPEPRLQDANEDIDGDYTEI